jgi:protein-L-isoaspartate(D-aspartate) O-methyltransferase
MKRYFISVVCCFFCFTLLAEDQNKMQKFVPGDSEGWLKIRHQMVELLKDYYSISNEAVLQAMEKVPRHLFIPEKFRTEVDPYGDHPCSIGYGQTISQPYIVAYMTEKINIQKGDKVLEIGTGSGYQSAILSELGAKVFSIEIMPELAKHARSVLEKLKYSTVKVITGDGYKGLPEEAPFDAIIVTCAPPEIPEELLKQLKDGGRLIAPVGTFDQRLITITRSGTNFIRKEDLPVRFVPMLKEKKESK